MSTAFTHYYAWRNNPTLGLRPCPKRLTLFGRPCRILARGKMNSIIIEFVDGQRECVSRNAVKQLPIK